MKKRIVASIALLIMLFAVLVFNNEYVRAIPREVSLHMVVGPSGMVTHLVDLDNGIGFGFFRNTNGTIDVTTFDFNKMVVSKFSDLIDSNAAFVQNGVGGFCPIVDNGNLFYLKAGVIGAGKTTDSFVQRQETNGQNMVCIYLNDNETIDLTSGIVSDGENLYFIRLSCDIETGIVNAAELCSTDFNSKRINKILSFPSEENVRYTVYGAFSDIIVLQKMEENAINSSGDECDVQFSIETVSVSEKKLNATEFNWNNGEISTSMNEATFIIAQDTALYLNDMEADTIKIINVKSLPDDCIRVVLTGTIYDNHVLTYGINAEDEIAAYGAIDLDTGEYTECALTFLDSLGVDYSTTILGENEEYFLVLCGADYVHVTDYLSNGEPYEYDRRIEQYGLIKKIDFWKNIDNINSFENTIRY